MTQNENISDIIDITSEAVTESDPIPSSPPKTRRRYGVYGLGILALLGSVALGGWFYKDVLSNYFPSNQIQSMNARIDALEAANKLAGEKIDAVVGLTDEIRSQLGAAQTAAEEARKVAIATKTESVAGQTKLLAVEKSLGAATAIIDDLKSKIASAPIGNSPAESSALLTRVDKLEKDLSNTQLNTSSAKVNVAQLSKALADLSEKSASGAAFTNEILVLRQIIPAAEGLDILNANAEKGVATQQQLAQSLKIIATELSPKPESKPAAVDNSWWVQASSIMSGLVTVKTVDAVDWQELAMQCSGLAEQGRIGESLKLLEQNLESLPKPLQDWRIMAAKRLSVNQALEKVGSAISREIAARG